jgi:glycosyltransferase involved in cell wall biosynthesis
MLTILTTHPIQYQVALWQALARDGRVPFEVWFMTDHGVRVCHDPEFGKSFAWDLEMLEGYTYRFLPSTQGTSPSSFWKCRLRESLAQRMLTTGTKVLWVQGWQVAAYWQAVWVAKRTGVEVWLRGESNDLAPSPLWKRAVKRLCLERFFGRVDHFIYIGTANRRLYEKYSVTEAQLHPGLYAVDNERFSAQAKRLRTERGDLRNKWGIPLDSFCVLFCGKFSRKKRPQDVVAAAQRLIESRELCNIHLLFVGSGELGDRIRRECFVVKDADPDETRCDRSGSADRPPASFAGFLNQTEVCQAYVAADCLVLPSDYGETWGLVINEAMAAGLPCIMSDRCGASLDLAQLPPNRVFACGDLNGLAAQLADLSKSSRSSPQVLIPDRFSFATTVSTVASLCTDTKPADK